MNYTEEELRKAFDYGLSYHKNSTTTNKTTEENFKHFLKYLNKDKIKDYELSFVYINDKYSIVIPAKTQAEALDLLQKNPLFKYMNNIHFKE